MSSHEDGFASMTSFAFKGKIPSSKSIFNRLLIIQSFESSLAVLGETSADDVLKMQTALSSLTRGPLDCGSAGTTLRFLALRASRIPGEHLLKGSERLFQRPQTELVRILEKLGCEVELRKREILIISQGWKFNQSGIQLDRSVSSQFASGVVLSSWNLTSPLRLKFDSELGTESVSEGYFQMTLRLVESLGMKIQRLNDQSLLIPAFSRVDHSNIPNGIEVEPDLSSAFAISALAAVSGSAEIEGWPEESLQPDRVFVDVLAKMGCRIKFFKTANGKRNLLIEKADQLKAVEVDLRDSPDLFPVLSVLCALAQGASRLYGAPHLVFKESSRIEKTSEILRFMGARFRIQKDGIEIDGPAPDPEQTIFTFDPADDHRLAMAAAVAKIAGYKIDIQHPDVVKKSYPEFWSVVKRSSSGANRIDRP